MADLSKEQSIRFILKTLNSPMSMMSPNKDKARDYAEEYNISVLELIEEYDRIVRKV